MIRRHFLQTSAAVMAATAVTPTSLLQKEKPLRLGLIIGIGADPDASIAKVHDLGLSTCQAYIDGNTCTVTGMIWTDIDKTHAKLQVCVQCLDKSGKERYDSGAIRPPSSVKPPAGLSTKMVESISIRELPCSPVWARWELTFAEGISEADRTNQKSAFEEVVKGYVNNTDAAGNTCHISGTNWTDNDATHSTLTVCIECVDRDQRAIGDTTAVRPPSGIRPPAGIIARLLQQ